MEKPSLSSHPPNFKNREELEEARKRFIEGQELNEENDDTPSPKDKVYPWDAPYVRKDVKKLFSLRFTEPDMLKLQYIHEKTGKSMHQFCMEHLLPAIESELDRIESEE